jgi:hypothetical protein
MPRDIGTGLYHYPEGTPGNPAQTIFSTRYNTFINDLANTLNQELPINMGGTGADNPIDARTNIKAEVSGQQVTNYDTQIWENGSFYSNIGATGAPLPDKPFWGIAFGIDQNNIFIEAHHGPLLYTRLKMNGVWSVWQIDTTTGGDIIIDKDNPAIWLDKNLSGQQAVVYGGTAAKVRWAVVLGNNLAETGGNVGSDFGIYRYDDAGAYIGGPPCINIARNTGHIGLTGNTWVHGDLTVYTSPTQGTIRFSETDPLKYLWFNGSDFAFNGGSIYLEANKGINCNWGVFAGNVTISGTLNASNTNVSGTLSVTGSIASQSYVGAKSTLYIDGTGSTNSPTISFRNESLLDRGYVYFDRAMDEMVTQHATTATKWRIGSSWVASSHNDAYKPNGGSWLAGSDARIKTVTGDYAHGLTEVLALHPVRFTYKGNDQFGKVYSDDPTTGNHSAVVGKEFIGLVAQECETVMPEMINKVPGFIDGVAVDDMRTLDSTALIYALVNAVKTLTARIEVLEAAQAPP